MRACDVIKPRFHFRQSARRRARRERLIGEAWNRHGAAGFAALFDIVEADIGDADLRIDGRLERLVEADPTALELLR
jgi:hypothetical protein